MTERRTRYLLQEDLSFPKLYRTLAGRWLWLPLAIIAGGIVGMAVGFLLPGSYRASASLGIALDYGRTHPLNEAAERVALLQVQGVLLSDDTLADALRALPDEVLNRTGISEPDELRSAVRLDRFENRWELSGEAARPADAAALANAWAEAGVANLRAAVEHAVRARELQSQIHELGCSLQLSESTGEAVWRCELGEALPADDLPAELVEEAQASYGVPAGLSFALLREATPPSTPIYGGREGLVLGGALSGLAIGFLFVILWPVAPRKR